MVGYFSDSRPRTPDGLIFSSYKKFQMNEAQQSYADDSKLKLIGVWNQNFEY